MVSNGLFPQVDQVQRWKTAEWSTHQSVNTTTQTAVSWQRKNFEEQGAPSQWWGFSEKVASAEPPRQESEAKDSEREKGCRFSLKEQQNSWHIWRVLSLHKTYFYYSQHQTQMGFSYKYLRLKCIDATLNPQLLEEGHSSGSCLWMLLVGPEEFCVKSFLAALIHKP